MRSTNDKVDSRESRLAQYAAEGFGESVLSHWVEVSKAHAYFCWKATVEFLRLSPNIAGHSWWLFQDILGASNGLVDYTFQPKNGALAPDQIGHFVDNVVLLISNGTLWKLDEQSAVYEAGSTIAPQLVVSNYHPDALSACKFTWSADLTSSPSSSFASGTFSVASFGQGTVGPAGAPLSIHLPTVQQPSRFNLSVAMTCAELPRPRVNDWQAWIYPQAGQVASGGREIFASPSIIGKLKSVAPDAKPLPATIDHGSSALYVASQDDLAAAAPSTAAGILAAVEAGSRLLVPEFAPCAARDGCAVQCTAPCNATVQSELIPFVRSPLLFHSPWWTNDAVTPTALFWAKPGYFEEGKADSERSGLAALGTEDGRIDDGWFGGLGPVPSSCPGRIRTGIAFNKPANAPAAPGLGKWPCPKDFPFPSKYHPRICYNESRYAQALGGPCNSWCTDDPTCANCRGSCSFIHCSTAAPNVTACPAEFPHSNASGPVPDLCYNNAKDAAAGSGPCDSWCTKRVWAGCGCKCGCGCGDPAQKLCSCVVGGGCAPPPPPPPPVSFKHALTQLNGTLLVGAVFGSNFASPSAGSGSTGSPLGGVIASLPKGKGKILLSGVDLDLEECTNSTGAPNPHQLFDETLLKALVGAAQS